jgi:hypothetical protein
LNLRPLRSCAMWYFALTYAASPEIAATDAAAAVASIWFYCYLEFFFSRVVECGCEGGTGCKSFNSRRNAMSRCDLPVQDWSVLLLAEFGAKKMPRSSQFCGSCLTRREPWECGGDLARRTVIACLSGEALRGVDRKFDSIVCLLTLVEACG